MRIYVGNMNFKTSEAQLRALFERFGQVDEVAIINDRATGRPRGIAFVIMPHDDEARSAMNELDGNEFDGRVLTVNEAKPRATQRTGPPAPERHRPLPPRHDEVRQGGYANHRVNTRD